MAHTKKKVLIFVPVFPVLSETFIEREIAALASKSTFDIVVMSLRKSTGFVSEHVTSRTRYVRLAPWNIIKGFCYLTRVRSLVKLLKESLHNSNRSLFSSVYLLVKALGYAELVAAYNVDHIHAHFLSESSTLMYFVAVLLGKPFSISAHARDVFGSSGRAYMNAELVEQKASYASFITVCNERAFHDCQVKAGVKNISKIHLNYHGFDGKYVSEIKPINLVSAKPLIFSIGRLVEKKGYTYLLQAASLLKTRGVDFDLKIAGPGPLYSKLLGLVNQLSLVENVEILGNGKGIQNTEAIGYLKSASVFVLPSIQTDDKDAEGIPNTLVEAAFCRIPIVATFSGSIGSFIEHTVSGILVPPADSTALANGIEQVLTDTSGFTRQYVTRAYEKAGALFGLNKSIDALEKLFLG